MERPSGGTVVITGVSSGIGLETARTLVAGGRRVFGSVRRPEDGARVQAELGTGFTPLYFDVCDAHAVAAGAARVRRALEGQTLRALINNAGTTVLGPLSELDTRALRRQFEANLFGLFEVTRQFLPLLGALRRACGPPGRIINLSSVSGRIAYPFFGAYAASKHALEGLSDALRRELALYGIDVILIEPSIVATPLVEKSVAQAEAFRDGDYVQALEATLSVTGIRPRQGTPGRRAGRGAVPVQRVVRAILRALDSPRPRARYVVAQSRWRGWILPRLLPARLLDRAVAGVLGLRPRDAGGRT